jgi:hypothetical protein
MKQGLLRPMSIAAAALAAALLGACSSTPWTGSSVTYTYEPRYSFAEARAYRWLDARATYYGDPLLEANVRYLTDRLLQSKGLSAKPDAADLVVSIRYELGSGYDLRSLILNIARADNGELVWRGMATGSIKTDAASGELKAAVEGMLANFPPTPKN